MLKKIISSRNIEEAIKEENSVLKFAFACILVISFIIFILFRIGYIEDVFNILVVISVLVVSLLYLVGYNIYNVYKLKIKRREASKYDKQLLATDGVSGTVVSLISETCLAIDKHYNTVDGDSNLYRRYRLKIETDVGDIITTEPFERVHGKLKDQGEAYSLLGCGDPDVLSYYENTTDNVVGMHCKIYTGYDRCIVKIKDIILDAY